MHRYSTKILRLVVLIAGVIVLAFCGAAAWNAFATPPTSEFFVLSCVFFIGTCAAAVPCYVALYQSYRLLRAIDTGRAFSEQSIKALKIITRSALAEFFICAFGGLPFFYALAQKEDAPGFVLIGMGIAGVAFIITVFASVLNQLLQTAIAIKSENDLTI